MQNPYNKYTQNQPKVKPGKTKGKKPRKTGRPVRETRKKVKKNSVKLSMSFILLSFFGLALSFYIFAYTDDFIDLLSRVEVSFSSAVAADEAKTAPQLEKPADISALKTIGKVDILKSSDSQLTMKNASVYEALRNKRLELEKKERRLARLEEDLQKQKIEIEKQLKELTEIRRNISSKLDKRVTADQESVNKLVGVYSNMKPQNAAVIISQLDEELAVKVLGKMKKQNAAAILNYVEPKKAQTLSEKYAGLKR